MAILRFTPFFYLLFLFQSVAADYRLWTEADFSYDFNCRWSFQTRYSARFDREAGRAYQYFVEINFLRNLSRGWKIVPGYRQELFRNEESRFWKTREIPNIAVVKTIQFRGYDFSTRGRIEYRLKENILRYRQRFSSKLPQQFTPWQFHPHLYCELFFRGGGAGFSQYRLFAGMTNDILKAGYIYRVIRSAGRRRPNNILYLCGHYGF